MPEYICGAGAFRSNCKAAFSLLKTDAQTGRPLAGAIFELRSGPFPLLSCKSCQNGLACFPCLGAGDYTVCEMLAPPGYVCAATPVQVHIGKDGNVCLDGQLRRRTEIPNHKAPLAASE